MRVVPLSIVVVLLWTSCTKEDTNPANDYNQVNFEAPIVNQTNYYLRYEGQCGYFEPTGDTLVLWVALFNGYELQLAERFTEGSTSYSPYAFIYSTALVDGNLVITENIRSLSFIFSTYGSDTLKLSANTTKNLVQDHCIIYDGDTPFSDDIIGSISSFQMDTLLYQQKKVVSIPPDTANVDVFLLYDSRNIYVTANSEVAGWQPLLDPLVFEYALIDFRKE